MLWCTEINHTIGPCSVFVHAIEFINVIIVAGILVHFVFVHGEFSVYKIEWEKGKGKILKMTKKKQSF